MNARGAFSLGMLLLFVAILIPVGINTFNDGDKISRSETFTAPATITEDYDIKLTYTPVVSGSETVFVDDSTLTVDTNYTIAYTTGIISIASSSLDGGDVVLVKYTEQVDFGNAGAMWPFIPTIVLAIVVFNFYRSRRRTFGGL